MGGIIDSIFGSDDAADASRDAASLQAQAAREAIAEQRRALDVTRQDLAPFREFGAGQLQGVGENLSAIRNLAFSPEEQANFINQNPFFTALAEDAERRIFNRAAASGRTGAGGTAEALQNSILLLGNDLLNQDLARKTGATQLGFNAVNTGLNAAARTGAATQGAANAVSDLVTQRGNALAAGEVGAANAITQGRQSAANTALGIGSIIALSDRNEKEIIMQLDSGDVPMYLFKYKGSDKVELGTIAQEVEHIPGAVMEVGGKKYVNYGALDGY